MDKTESGSGVYTVRLGSDFDHWERFNLFLTVVGYDLADQVACYCSSTQKEADGTIMVISDPCARIEIFAYVIAGAFPETEVISEAPPFVTRLSVLCDGKIIENSSHSTNQWGGLTLSGYRPAGE